MRARRTIAGVVAGSVAVAGRTVSLRPPGHIVAAGASAAGPVVGPVVGSAGIMVLAGASRIAGSVAGSRSTGPAAVVAAVVIAMVTAAGP